MNINRDPLRDNWAGTGYLGAFATWMNSVAKKINSLHFARGGSAEIGPDYIRLRADEFDYSDLTFGATLYDATHITVESGYLLRPTGALWVSTQNVLVSAGATEGSPHYVYVSNIMSEAIGEIPTTALATFPYSDGVTFRKCLVEAYYADGVLQIGKRHHPGGDILVPGFAA